MIFSQVIEQLLDKKNLSQAQAFELMGEILAAKVLPMQVAALLTALRVKGESVDEMVGFAQSMRAAMVSVKTPWPMVADTCGTGGDGKNTFNISTAAAFVVAGAGIPVAKHGNRSVSSLSGSADVLEYCGVKLAMPLQTAKHCLADLGIVFLFAPLYHPAMKNVAPIRKEMGIRTVFNLLGPLCNPAGARAQVIGVSKKKFVPLIAAAFARLNEGALSGAVVLNDGGYDEWVLGRNCVASEIFEGQVRAKKLPANALGTLAKIRPEGGKSLKENAALLRSVLTEKTHPLRSVVLANAALSIYVFKKTSLQKAVLKDCLSSATESIDSGAAYNKLLGLIKYSQKSR